MLSRSFCFHTFTFTSQLDFTGVKCLSSTHEHLLSHKISPPSKETPPLNISNPMCSALFLPPLPLPLGPCSPSCCLPVFLPHSGYSTQEAGRVRLGSSKAQLSSQVCHDGAPLPLRLLPPSGQTSHPQPTVSQYLQPVMDLLSILLQHPINVAI